MVQTRPERARGSYRDALSGIVHILGDAPFTPLCGKLEDLEEEDAVRAIAFAFNISIGKVAKDAQRAYSIAMNPPEAEYEVDE